MPSPVRRLLAALLLLAFAPLARAACGDDPADAAAVAAARAAVEARCDCARTSSHKTYVACATGVAAELIDAGGLPKQCRRAVRRCAARSTCGRRGAVACCLKRKTRTKCKVLRKGARCLARGGCAAVFPSCCDACTTIGCRSLPTTTTTVTTTTTTTVTATTTTTTVTTTTTTTMPFDGETCLQTGPLPDGASEPVSCGFAVACAIDAPGDTDAFTIDLPAGAALAVSVTGPGVPCWQLSDPLGATLIDDCDQIRYAAPPGGLATGRYTITVFGLTSQQVTAYTLSVEGISEAFHCGADLVLPSDSTNDLLEPAGDTDSFQFVAAAGDVVNVSVGGASHPCWRLLGPDGQPVINTDTCAPAGASNAGPLVAGTHTIFVRQQSNQTTSYTLSIQKQ